MNKLLMTMAISANIWNEADQFGEVEAKLYNSGGIF
jgi:hypothetical protein